MGSLSAGAEATNTCNCIASCFVQFLHACDDNYVAQVRSRTPQGSAKAVVYGCEHYSLRGHRCLHPFLETTCSCDERASLQLPSICICTKLKHQTDRQCVFITHAERFSLETELRTMRTVQPRDNACARAEVRILHKVRGLLASGSPTHAASQLDR